MGMDLLGVDCAGATTSLGFNLIGNGVLLPGPGDQIGTEAEPIDPSLGPLQANGGPTHTHVPLPGSPAIDQGSSGDENPRSNRRGASL